MEKKPKDPGGPKAASESARSSGSAPRHRFSDEKTTIMPLAEILRQRDASPVEDGPSQKDIDDFNNSFRRPPSSGDNTVVQTRSPLTPAKREPPPPPHESKPSAPASKDRAVAPKQQPPTRTSEIALNPTPVPQARSTPPPVSAKGSTAPASTAAPAAAPQAGSTAAGKGKVTNQVVVFFSAKGGSGSTALACNVAHTYAKDQRRTCLVDMDLQLGDALAALALIPKATIANSIQTVGRVGQVLSTNSLPQHASGVSVLSQVGAIDDLDKINPEGMASLVEALRTSFDVAVVDGVRDFSDNVLAVLDVADKIAIITVQEVLAVRRARWAFSILRKIGFDPSDVTVVVNRFDPDSDIPFATLKRIFDPAPVMAVPSESRLVLQSLNRGVPLLELNASHTLTRNIGRLAANLLSDTPLETSEATVVRKETFWQRMGLGGNKP